LLLGLKTLTCALLAGVSMLLDMQRRIFVESHVVVMFDCGDGLMLTTVWLCRRRRRRSIKAFFCLHAVNPLRVDCVRNLNLWMM